MWSREGKWLSRIVLWSIGLLWLMHVRWHRKSVPPLSSGDPTPVPSLSLLGLGSEEASSCTSESAASFLGKPSQCISPLRALALFNKIDKTQEDNHAEPTCPAPMLEPTQTGRRSLPCSLNFPCLPLPLGWITAKQGSCLVLLSKETWKTCHPKHALLFCFNYMGCILF